MSNTDKPPLRPLEEIFPLLAKNVSQPRKDVASLISGHEGEIALLVVDVQKTYCDPGERGTEETVAIAEHIQSLAPEFRKAGIPVYAVYSGNAYNNPGFYKFSPEEQDTLVPKSKDSAFAKTPLQDMLEHDNKKLLLVCGFNRSACVKRTVLDARKAGFDVCVLEDLAGDDCWSTETSRNEADQELKYSGAILTTAPEVLKHLKMSSAP